MVRQLAQQVIVEPAAGSAVRGRAAATARPKCCTPTKPTTSTTRCSARAASAWPATRALPVPPDEDHAPPGEVRFRDETIGDDEVRVGLHVAAGPTAARRRRRRWCRWPRRSASARALATEIIKGVILPQFVILPVAVLLVWLALARGIAPLNELQQRIRQRESSDLSPIDERAAPEEVSPLVRAINDLLARLDQSIARAEALPRRCRASAEDAARRAAHAGRAGAARDRCRRARPAGAEGVAAADRALEPERRAHGEPAAGDGARRGRGAGARTSRP